MKILGTKAFTGKHVQAVVNKYGTHRRGLQKPGAYPLDAGYFTIKELEEMAKGVVSYKTIFHRLDSGCRVLAELIAPPLSNKARTPAKDAQLARNREKQRAGQQIRDDKAVYYRARKAAHKVLP